MTAAAPEAPRPNSLNIKAQCFPKWLRELDRFLPLKSQLFLYGNIYDCYYFPSNYVSAQSSADLKFTKYLDIKQVLREYLQSEDYELVCYYDMLDGFDIASKDPVLARGGLMPFLMEQDPRARAAFATAKSIEDLAKLPDALNVFRALVASFQLASSITHPASRAAPIRSLMMSAATSSKSSRRRRRRRSSPIAVGSEMSSSFSATS